jgi:hypothetical protein
MQLPSEARWGPCYGARVRPLLFLALLWAAPARAETPTPDPLTAVDPAPVVDAPIVEDTAHTLRAHEVKLGLLQSSYGLTDRLQLDSFLWLYLLSDVNLGLKYQVLNRPNLQLSAEVWGGAVAATLLAKALLYHWGVQGCASVPLAEGLTLHLVGGFRSFRLVPLARGVLFDGRVAWPTAKAELEYDLTRKHLLFLTLGTPLSWLAAINSGAHEFEATGFWSLTAGYQLRHKALNVRLDLGYGPSLFGRGLTGSVDLYLRFGG